MREQKIVVITLEVSTKHSDEEVYALMFDLHQQYNPFYRQSISRVDIFKQPIDLTNDRCEVNICNDREETLVPPNKEG